MSRGPRLFAYKATPSGRVEYFDLALFARLAVKTIARLDDGPREVASIWLTTREELTAYEPIEEIARRLDPSLEPAAGDQPTEADDRAAQATAHRDLGMPPPHCDGCTCGYCPYIGEDNHADPCPIRRRILADLGRNLARAAAGGPLAAPADRDGCTCGADLDAAPVDHDDSCPVKRRLLADLGLLPANDVCQSSGRESGDWRFGPETSEDRKARDEAHRDLGMPPVEAPPIVEDILSDRVQAECTCDGQRAERSTKTGHAPDCAMERAYFQALNAAGNP